MAEENISFNDVLSTLDTFTQDLCVFEAWVPSLQKNVTIKELTAKQQKQLLNFVVDSATSYKSFFAKPFYNILTENCNLSKQDIDNLSFIDYTSLAIAIRKQISETLKVEFTNDSETYSEDIALNVILENFQNLKYPEPQDLTTTKETLQVDLKIKIPTILDDVLYFDHLPTIKRGDSQEDALKLIVAEAYIYETSKCLSDVSINGKSINYSSLSVKQRYQLLERLPATILQKILSQYASWRKSIDQCLTVVSSRNDSKTLEIDTLLFLTS
jgi:hypothetical protein